MTENNNSNKKKQSAQKGIDLVMSRAIERVLAADAGEPLREPAVKKGRSRRSAVAGETVAARVKEADKPARRKMPDLPDADLLRAGISLRLW